MRGGPLARFSFGLIVRRVLGSYMIYVVVGGALLFQAYVTYRLWRSQVFDGQQKRAQSKLVWLVPVLGAAVVFSVLVDEEAHLAGKKDDTERRI
jgi:tellurite resistance protein TehA-like permease